MNFSIIFHAVFNEGGQQFWPGDTPAKSALSPFYGSSGLSVHAGLLVERKPINGKPAILYTYIRRGEFLDRQGQKSDKVYFAITIITPEDYYRDVVNFYNVLDESFRKYIVPRAVDVMHDTGKGTALRLKINAFSAIDSDLKSMTEEIKNYIKKFSDGSDLCPISQTGTNPTIGNDEINIIDFTEDQGIELLKKNKSFSVSPLFKTTQTKTETVKLDKVIGQKDKKLADMQAQLSKSEENRKRLEQENQALQSSLDASRKQVKGLKKDKEDNERYKEAIRDFSQKVPEFFGSQPPRPGLDWQPSVPAVPSRGGHHGSSGKQKRLLLIAAVCAAVCAVLVILLVWWLFLKPKDNRPDDFFDNGETTEQIDTAVNADSYSNRDSYQSLDKSSDAKDESGNYKDIREDSSWHSSRHSSGFDNEQKHE